MGVRRKLVREDDGTLFDVEARRLVSWSGLRDHLRDGGTFEARRPDTDVDCTLQVLEEALRDGGAAVTTTGIEPPGLFAGNAVLGALPLVARLLESVDLDERPSRTRTTRRRGEEVSPDGPGA